MCRCKIERLRNDDHDAITGKFSPPNTYMKNFSQITLPKNYRALLLSGMFVALVPLAMLVRDTDAQVIAVNPAIGSITFNESAKLVSVVASNTDDYVRVCVDGNKLLVNVMQGNDFEGFQSISESFTLSKVKKIKVVTMEGHDDIDFDRWFSGYSCDPLTIRAEVFAGPGNDNIHGGDGNDLLHGGVGDDDISGGHGADVLFGDGGNDDLVGGPRTVFDCGNGTDNFRGDETDTWATNCENNLNNN